MKRNRLILSTFFLSLLSLLFYSVHADSITLILSRVFDLIILILFYHELITGFRQAEYKQQFIRKNITLALFTFLYSAILLYLIISNPEALKQSYINLLVLVIRTIFLTYRSFENIKSIEDALRKMNERPAIAIFSSFLLIILTGTLLLMLPFTTVDRQGLSLINSLFTATSAVCVTGLIVVDTASVFSLGGRIIILALIQTGGLGIMIITYFSKFILGRRVTLEEKKRLSFVISDTDMSGIVSTLKKIIYLTFSIELIGSLILFIGFGRKTGFNISTAFLALFHAISAFCNAGFSLFSDSLMGFADDPLIIFTVSTLIILGGLSFAVIFNIKDITNHRKNLRKLNLTSKVVLSWTAVLLAAGFIFFYASEHAGSIKSYDTPAQYLAAFFQSVTLRTAGFNSVSFSHLAAGTIVVMCFFMFIGAASGSTAGGIKINTMAVLVAYLKSVITNSPKVTLFRYQLSRNRVLQAFIVFQYGIAAVFFGTAALTLSNNLPLKDILFETVSAFGTVGLSTGITAQLNSLGKIIIILLMFNGRLGPLTILATLSNKPDKSTIKYPKGDIIIG